MSPWLAAALVTGFSTQDASRSVLPEAGHSKGRVHDLVLAWEPRGRHEDHRALVFKVAGKINFPAGQEVELELR